MSDITAYTIIKDDIELLNWCIINAHRRAGVDVDWLIILAGANKKTEGYCKEVQEAFPEMNLKYVIHPEKQSATISDKTTRFLHNLYACFNMGYQHAETKWVVRMGSDQYFSRQWLHHLMAAADRWGERHTYHTWTVESPAAGRSRHPIEHFGTVWDEFDERRWDQYCNDIQRRHANQKALTAVEASLYHSHPARGKQLRPDGVTWLQTKALWEEFGPLHDGINEEGVTGDVSYMDKLSDNGIPALQVPSSLSYHLVRGESRDVQE